METFDLQFHLRAGTVNMYLEYCLLTNSDANNEILGKKKLDFQDIINQI